VIAAVIKVQKKLKSISRQEQLLSGHVLCLSTLSLFALSNHSTLPNTKSITLYPLPSISLSYDFENIPRTDFIPARGDFSFAPFLSVSFIDAFEVEDLWRYGDV
jgi:hypothetical protein